MRVSLGERWPLDIPFSRASSDPFPPSSLSSSPLSPPSSPSGYFLMFRLDISRMLDPLPNDDLLSLCLLTLLSPLSSLSPSPSPSLLIPFSSLSHSPSLPPLSLFLRKCDWISGEEEGKDFECLESRKVRSSVWSVDVDRLSSSLIPDKAITDSSSLIARFSLIEDSDWEWKSPDLDNVRSNFLDGDVFSILFPALGKRSPIRWNDMLDGAASPRLEGIIHLVLSLSPLSLSSPQTRSCILS